MTPCPMGVHACPPSNRSEVFTADGEPAEQLCPAYFAKLSECKVRAVWRCGAHSAQRSLENSLAADAHASALVSNLITKYSTGRDSPGGFARAVNNSPKLKSSFSAAAQRLDGILGGAARNSSMSFAAQRFNTILDVSQAIIYNLPAVISLLTEVQITDPHLAPWARGLLACLSTENLLLLACLAELTRIAASTIHRYDNDAATPGAMAESAQLFFTLKEELYRMFFFKSPRGEVQEPLIFCDPTLQDSFNC